MIRRSRAWVHWQRSLRRRLRPFYVRRPCARALPIWFKPLPDGSVQRLTWAEVGEQARRAAGYLASLQLPAGSCIGLLAANCAHWIVADLAIWMAGHISVPLHPGLTVDFISQVVRHTDLYRRYSWSLGGLAGPECGFAG
ncbi:AMP-binding protein [Halopseudomonas pachastrellae]|nr:AMP-binding protein [Halopseudomonas pachastrellae]